MLVRVLSSAMCRPRQGVRKFVLGYLGAHIGLSLSCYQRCLRHIGVDEDAGKMPEGECDCM